ncbi:MAG: T9SS type A sorting domain-containing protein [Saprospiraceae bacterium]|nr:T9SS type A sorting domain-containing protein [Saprospiraceae bacterium]
MYDLNYRRLLFLFIIIFLVIIDVFSRSLYVSSSKGSDKNSGESKSQAFLTIQYAADQSQAGDTILIDSGYYASYHKVLLRITRSGEKGRPIVYKNLYSQRPVFYVSNEAAISLLNVFYIEIEGIEITSDPDFENRFTNQEFPFNLTSKGHGIQIERSRDPNFFSHHIRIKDNYIHDCPGSAIDVFSADYLEILFNTLESNGRFSSVSNCGIRIQFLQELDQANTDHIKIMYNQISNQRIQGTLSKINNSCEENYGASGIAIRNNRFDPLQALKLAYSQKIRICDNLIYLNGGLAIDIFETNNFFINNNTCYQNNQNPESTCGEVQINKSKNCLVQNNIFYSRIGMKGSSVSNYENIQFRNNLYFNSKSNFKGEKDLNEDPQFTRLDHHGGIFEFELRPKSPAINTGTLEGINSIDFHGHKRVISLNVDLGAIEYTGTLPRPRDSELMRIDRRHMSVSWQASYSQTTGQIIIHNSKGDIYSAKLYNHLGKLLMQNLNINGAKRGIEFDVSGLPNGLYFLLAFSGSDKYTSKYMVKNTFENLYREN